LSPKSYKEGNFICEICGESTNRKIIRIIEGVKMIVCSNCAEFGDEPPKKYKEKTNNFKSYSYKPMRQFQQKEPSSGNIIKQKPRYKKTFSPPRPIVKYNKINIEDLELKPDYRKILMKFRQSKNMTQAEFADSVGLSANLYKNVENKKMDLTIQDALKIEQKYKIKLTQEVSEENEEELIPAQFIKEKEEYTLGDVFIERKKKKKS